MPYQACPGFCPGYRKKLTAALFLVCVLGAPLFSQTGNSQAGNAGVVDFNSPGEPGELAAALVNGMSDEEALAQTFMFGWTGAAPSPLIMDWIRLRRVGGVKVFGWNAENLETLAEAVGAMQRAALADRRRVPLLVATDQEGGMVRHIKGQTSETPGNASIGAGGFPADAYRTGYHIGRELALLGINMNFAPVVDISTVKDSALLGSRTFGDDPVQTGILGTAFMKGLAASGVIATAKHFPGHGGTSLDSHGVLPRIDADEALLWERELVPYRMMSRSGLPAVMSGHLAFPRTPGGDEPASLSPWFLTDLLRNRIGFEGMVITDDLRMYGAFLATGSLARTAREALLAGNDMLLISSTPALHDEVWTSLLALMKTDGAFRRRVRDAACRVLRIKLIHLRGNGVPPVPGIDGIRKGIPDPGGRAFFLDQAARGIRAIKRARTLSPSDRVLLAGRYGTFFAAGRRAWPGAAAYHYGEPSAAVLAALAAGADRVILCLENGADLRLLESLRLLNKPAAVLCAAPSVPPAWLRYINENGWIDSAAALHGTSEQSFIAGFSFLLGGLNPPGLDPPAPNPPDLNPPAGAGP
ncbi:MAG: glycoside hydrolase family 3 protein [Treponema sp.]|jgi:beta-N-acetylhexosaminidase|nr:glycoside hydrolase family 3 protein [Treponema sp.]